MTPSKQNEEMTVEMSAAEQYKNKVRTEMIQVRNLSDIYGFVVAPMPSSGQRMLLCGQKRKWGNSYKRYAVPVHESELLKAIMKVLGSGGKVFEVK